MYPSLDQNFLYILKLGFCRSTSSEKEQKKKEWGESSWLSLMEGFTDASFVELTWLSLMILFPGLSNVVGGKPTSSITLSCFRVNITVGALEERMMLSGMHTVADIFCCCCGQIVGWKYEAVYEKSQKYKEGKFVLERGRIVDGIDFSSEVYIDTRPSMSDGEEA
ncbi:hypothetical protein V6N13_013063 [Hibiscus sabdariffa]|uniref:Protein yippee-like n=1 Tax=Hibiscus sabdariffa TaxID=183260 RepID=A0ABR2SHV4_9ROSI